MTRTGINLYVDDIRKAPTGWHLARSVSEAIRILDTMLVQYLSVDHDKCHSEDGKKFACDDTFESVVRFALRLPKENRPKIACHSGNPGAYDAYQNLCEQSGEKLYALDWLMMDIEEDELRK